MKKISIKGIAFERTGGEPGYYCAFRDDDTRKVVGFIKRHRPGKHYPIRSVQYKVEGLPGGVRPFLSLEEAREAIAAHYGEGGPAAPVAPKVEDKGLERLERVMRDLKNQGDSKATAVLEMLENVRDGYPVDGFDEAEMLKNCIEEVESMGDWGRFAAKELRGLSTPVLTTECPPCQMFAPINFLTMAEDYRALKSALRGLMEYVGGWDEKPGHPCATAAALLKKLEGK